MLCNAVYPTGNNRLIYFIYAMQLYTSFMRHLRTGKSEIGSFLASHTGHNYIKQPI